MAAAAAAGDEWPGFSVRMTEEDSRAVLWASGEVDPTMSAELGGAAHRGR
jgi:hypothetical protein